MKLEPENDEFWFMKGGALTIQKKYEEAIYCLDKALIFNPKNLSALLIKAEAYEKQEKFQEALDFIEKVLKIYPNNDMALYKKSIILKKKKGEKSKSPIKKESQNLFSYPGLLKKNRAPWPGLPFVETHREYNRFGSRL